MRTFLSHDATARCSDCGENWMSEMLSSGRFGTATSLERSPDCGVELAAALPNNAMGKLSRFEENEDCIMILQSGRRESKRRGFVRGES